MSQQQQQPSVFGAKKEYRKAALRIYGTVGELTNTLGDMNMDDGGSGKGNPTKTSV
jgi:hypothetical protein